MTDTVFAREDQYERAVRAGGVTTRFLEAGSPDNPTVVLLHDGAWGGASDVTWGACLPRLAERFQVIAPDFLGYGGSDKATYFDRSSYTPRIAQIESLLDALLVENPHVVGSSYGGSVALRMLAESSVPLRSVVSIGGSGAPWKTEVMLQELGRWDGSRDDLARVLRFLMDDASAGFAEQLALREQWAMAPGHYRSVASATLALPERLQQPIADPWPASLKTIETPTLLVAGRYDQLFEADWPERIQELLHHAEITRIDSRHSPNLDHQEEIVEVVTNFLEAVSEK
jgi:pimeloyl-ACP methyl ester carboxylesterase